MVMKVTHEIRWVRRLHRMSPRTQLPPQKCTTSRFPQSRWWSPALPECWSARHWPSRVLRNPQWRRRRRETTATPQPCNPRFDYWKRTFCLLLLISLSFTVARSQHALPVKSARPRSASKHNERPLLVCVRAARTPTITQKIKTLKNQKGDGVFLKVGIRLGLLSNRLFSTALTACRATLSVNSTPWVAGRFAMPHRATLHPSEFRSLQPELPLQRGPAGAGRRKTSIPVNYTDLRQI